MKILEQLKFCVQIEFKENVPDIPKQNICVGMTSYFFLVTYIYIFFYV